MSVTNVTNVAAVSQNLVSSTEARSALSIYSTRLKVLRTELATVQSRRRNSLLSMILFIALTVISVVLALNRHNLPLSYAAFPITVSIYFSMRYIRSGTQWREIQKRCCYFEHSIRRLTGAWKGDGRTGEEFARAQHHYQSDLNVIGNGSLFELLCTTRSELGAERLAQYLLDPASMDESRLRQQAVKELRDAHRLREEMDIIGDFRSQDCGHQALAGWLHLPPITLPPVIRYLLMLSSATTLVVLVEIVAGILFWTQWWQFTLALIVFQTGTAGLLLRRVRPRIKQLRVLTNAFTILQQGLQLMEKQQFNSPKLQKIVERIRSQNASARLKSLEWLVRLFDQREKEQFQYLFCLLAVGTQLVLAVDHWRIQHQQYFYEWMDAWAEFEAIQAIAGYAFEHPDYAFPELRDGEPVFEATQLGHPLLDAKNCICNDIVLNSQSRFYLITGSNMAGKSTVLRSIGLNTVIALAGGPVRASSARLSPLTICASLAITDSLLEGRSKFLAEVARLSESIAVARSGKPVLFLIDEILSGTNSSDRRTAAEAVVRILLQAGAIGAISTHDLALSHIVDDPSLSGVLVHMESNQSDDPLAFDYLLKPGISSNSNALAIVRMMGIGEVQDLKLPAGTKNLVNPHLHPTPTNQSQ